MNNPSDTEVVTPSALEAISSAEVSVAISTARRFPRQLHAVKTKMLSFATLDEDTAASCFYTLPRGGKNIQGPSVRLAEIALSCYGNIRAGTRIIQTVTTGDTPHVVIQAVCMDLENNNSVSIEKRRRITSKKDFKTGGRKPIDEDDVNLAANAGSAIAFRDAVFKVVPLALVKPVFEAARKVAIGDAKTLVDRRAKCIETFGKMGIPKEKVLAKLELKSIEEVTLEHLETLIGLHNAIKEGEVSLDEAFNPPQPTAKPADVSDLGPVTGKPVAAAGPTVATAGNAAPQPAPTQPEAPKAAETPQTAPAGTQAAKEPPICAYCGQPTDANHSCPGLQEAIAKQAERTGTPAEQEAAEQAERRELLASVGTVITQNEVELPQLMAYLEAVKVIKKGQKLSDLATSKLRTINKSVQNPQTIVEIKKAK